MKLLFIDTETGGLDPTKHSLLTIALVYWHNKKIADKLEIKISKEKYIVVNQAMKVNKIDLKELKETGVSEDDAVSLINSFVNRHFGSQVPVIAGHNVGFDIAFLTRLYTETGHVFKRKFSHRSVDTSSILRFLYHSGILEDDISGSDAAFQFFKINIPKELRHTALGDALATAELYNGLLEKVNKK